MSCWGNYDNREAKVGECPECGADVDEEGLSVYGCSYSSSTCDTCKDQPCDQSC